MKKTLALVCAGLALCLSQARAEDLLPPADGASVEDGLKPMDDAELAGMRGGLLTPMGLDIGFAAQVRTYVDGQLALETRLAWTEQGPVSQRLGDLSAMTAAGLAPQTGGGWDLVLPGLGGDTRVLHDLTDGRIASVIVNSASGRDLRQDTSIQLTIPQLPELQSQLAASRLISTIQGAVGLALADRVGR